MPPPRGTVVLCDLIDHHDETINAHEQVIVDLLDMVEQVTGDGFVSPDETKLLKSAKKLTQQSLRTVHSSVQPLRARAAETDDAMRGIGALAHAGRVSKHVKYLILEAAADAA